MIGIKYIIIDFRSRLCTSELLILLYNVTTPDCSIKYAQSYAHELLPSITK